MAYSITNVIADLEGALHGTTTNQITNLYGIFNRAARKLLLDVDPQETKRTLPFANPIFNDVYDYPIPVDLKGNKVIDIKPQVNRTPGEVFQQSYNQAFDQLKATSFQDGFTIDFNTAVKTIRIAAPFLPPPVPLNECNSTNQNGTWTTGDDATNLTVNNQNFVGGGSSLSFDLDGSTTDGFLVNSTSQAQNIENMLNQGILFLYTYLPTGSTFTSIELQWGSSASDYYSRSVTTTQQNTAFQNGWNLLAFNWLGASVTGTPDPTSITYLKVIWNYNGSVQTGVLLDSISANLGSILDIEYYSKYLFRNASTGAFQETVTSNNDLINLDTESYNLFFNLVAWMAGQQQQGANALAYDANFFLQQYNDGLARYRSMYKSEVQKPRSVYYLQPNPNNNWGWWGQGGGTI